MNPLKARGGTPPEPYLQAVAFNLNLHINAAAPSTSDLLTDFRGRSRCSSTPCRAFEFQLGLRRPAISARDLTSHEKATRSCLRMLAPALEHNVHKTCSASLALPAWGVAGGEGLGGSWTRIRWQVWPPTANYVVLILEGRSGSTPNSWRFLALKATCLNGLLEATTSNGVYIHRPSQTDCRKSILWAGAYELRSGPLLQGVLDETCNKL